MSDHDLVVWRETVGRHAHPSTVVAHAVNGPRTLCGEPSLVAPWRDTGRGTRCAACIAATTATAAAPVSYREVQEAVPGLTYRMLDYWSRRGFLKPSNPDCGKGHHRSWPAEEVEIARVMHVLVQSGLSPEGAERAARHGGVLADGVRVTVTRAGLVLP